MVPRPEPTAGGPTRICLWRAGSSFASSLLSRPSPRTRDLRRGRYMSDPFVADLLPHFQDQVLQFVHCLALPRRVVAEAQIAFGVAQVVAEQRPRPGRQSEGVRS